MADPNFIVPYQDDPYYTPYTDDTMNIVDNMNPSLLADSPLIPLSSEKSKDAIDIDSPGTLSLDFWDSDNESDGRHSGANPLEINDETSNQIDINLVNESLNINNLHIPTLEDRLAVHESFSFPILTPQFSEERGEAIDPLRKTIISGGMCNESNAVNSMVIWKSSNERETHLGTQSLDNMNSTQISGWPSEPVPFGCSGCEILREIIHIKGRHVMKLQIHGRLGIFYHAILDVQTSTEAVTSEIFDFYKKDNEEVKQFLTQYCIKRNQEGYMVIKDPRSTFYEAVCVRLDGDENQSDGDYMEKTLTPDPRDIQRDETANDRNYQEQPPLFLAAQIVATASNKAVNTYNKEKSPFFLVEQRRRVKEITYKELSNYFDLPRKEAAEKLGFSETVVHNIWLKTGGTGRWPYRKVHSIKKEISKLRGLLNSDDPHERVRARKEIRKKEEEMAELYRVPD